jgi:hypothetical protein
MLKDLEVIYDKAAWLAAMLQVFEQYQHTLPDGEWNQIALCQHDLNVIGLRLAGVLKGARAHEDRS